MAPNRLGDAGSLSCPALLGAGRAQAAFFGPCRLEQGEIIPVWVRSLLTCGLGLVVRGFLLEGALGRMFG